MITGGWHIPYNQTLFFHNLPARFDAFYHFELRTLRSVFGSSHSWTVHRYKLNLDILWWYTKVRPHLNHHSNPILASNYTLIIKHHSTIQTCKQRTWLIIKHEQNSESDAVVRPKTVMINIKRNMKNFGPGEKVHSGEQASEPQTKTKRKNRIQQKPHVGPWLTVSGV